ncbi:MAG: YbaK/EbsC family protein [Thermodesulfovibrionales bacterium]
MAASKLTEYLDDNHVKYEKIEHTPSYTAQEIAAVAHVRGKDLAKTVMIKINDKIAMAVLPSLYKIDFDMLKNATGAKKIELASEEEFEDIFPDCEIGAMPPFGNLYGIDVYVAEKLTEDEEIAFNAGSHTELIKLSYKDMERLVHPKVAKFASA